MTILSLLLIVKITVTALVICVPLLSFPAETLAAAHNIDTKDPTLFRLYGVAVLSLLVGYGFGVAEASNGLFPHMAVGMGVVSNAGATLVLISTGAWRRHALLAGFFGTLSLLLILLLAFPEASLMKLSSVG